MREKTTEINTLHDDMGQGQRLIFHVSQIISPLYGDFETSAKRVAEFWKSGRGSRQSFVLPAVPPCPKQEAGLLQGAAPTSRQAQLNIVGLRAGTSHHRQKNSLWVRGMEIKW